MDGQRFDDLTRRMAFAINRRGFLRAVVGGVAASLLSARGSRDALAAPCPGGAPACNGVCCSGCETCKGNSAGARCVTTCKAGLPCLNGECVCPDGQPICGGGASVMCCEGGSACVNGRCVCPGPNGPVPACQLSPGAGNGLSRVTCCAGCERCGKNGCQPNCPPGQVCDVSGQCRCVRPRGERSMQSETGTPCGSGPTAACCEGGCSNGVCTCAAGQTLCQGDRCCDSCQVCTSSGCKDACPGNTLCVDGACRCPDGQPVCGQGGSAACCEDGATCVNGTCQCQGGETPCISASGPNQSDVRLVRCCNACETCGPAGPGKKEPSICRSTCAQGAACDNGQCTCPAGEAPCGTGAAAICCDSVCEQCKNGKCTSKCPAGTTCTGNQCHCPDGQPVCGTGSNAACCEGGASCINGTCRCPGPSGSVDGCEVRRKPGPGPSSGVRLVICCAACERCSKSGGCDTLCTNPEICGESGLCVCPDGRPACPAGQGRVCCGACQVCGASGCEPCAPGVACVDGACQCAPGLTPCGAGCCDPAAGQTCVDGECRCLDGSSACNGACCDSTACEICSATGCVSNCAEPCQVCDGGRCVDVACAQDEDPCTVAICDPARGGCVTDPVVGCCREDIDCTDDGGACVDMACDPETNRCIPEPRPDGATCDDGDPCTGPGVCQAGECEPGASLCGPCQVCTEEGCVPAEDGAACPDGTCCGDACLPPCPAPRVRTADCSCACPSVECPPGSALDPDSCACCQIECLPGECGQISDGCGGFLACAPCVVCADCTPFGAPCGSAGPCCSGICDEETGLCTYIDSDDGFCFVAGEPCPNPEEMTERCCGACIDGCCGCRDIGAACATMSECCAGTCFGQPGTSTCCVPSGGLIAESCGRDGECCSGRCEGGLCACAAVGEPCSISQVQCCEGASCYGFDEVLGPVCALL